MVVYETKEKYLDNTKIIEKMKASSIVGFDFETTGLDIVDDVVVGIGLSNDKGDTVYLPFKHNEAPCFDEKDTMEKLRDIFLDENVLLIVQNVPFDIQFLWKEYNIDISHKFSIGMVADTQIMSWLDNENRKNHKLSHLCKTILKINMRDLDEILNGGSILDADIKELADYGKLDARVIVELYHYFIKRLEKQKLLDVFWKVEMPYALVLAKKKRRGIDVNLELLSIYKNRIDKEIEELEENLYEQAGKQINFNSGKQLGDLLFGDVAEGGLGAPVISYTAGGKKPKKDGTFKPPQPKTSKEVFQVLEKHEGKPYHKFIKYYQRYKKLTHTRSNFIDALPALINSDGRVRTGFLQTGTVSGRLSSTKPNLQNQPTELIWVDKYYIGKTYPVEDLYEYTINKKGVSLYRIPGTKEELAEVFPYHVIEDEGEKGEKFKDEQGHYFLVHRKIRDLYYNRDGVLLVADYSQMEMRLMAHFSGDKNLLDAFKEEKDIHTWGAALVKGISEDEVTSEMRQNSKAVNFGTIYGKTVYGYAIDWYSQEPDFIKGYDNYGNPKIADKYLHKAEDYLTKFFEAFPGIAEFMDYTEAYCRKFGFVKTLTGRRRRLPAILSDKQYQRERARRQGTNTRIQGSAGDYIKMAQIILDRELWDKGVEQAIQVHDELVFPVLPEVGEKYINRVKEIMETVVPLRVKIVTNPILVNSWGQAK